MHNEVFKSLLQYLNWNPRKYSVVPQRAQGHHVLHLNFNKSFNTCPLDIDSHSLCWVHVEKVGQWRCVYTGYGSAAGSERRSASHWRSHVSPAPTPLPLLTSTLSFLKLYGRRFSKEDHILFIKLLYELVTLPNLEPHMMQNYARLLIQLLRWVWHNELVYTNTTRLSFSPHSGAGLKHPDRASRTTAHSY